MPFHDNNLPLRIGEHLVELDGPIKTKHVGVERSFGLQAGAVSRNKKRNKMMMDKVNSMNNLPK